MYWRFRPTYVPSSSQSPVTIETCQKFYSQLHISGSWTKSTFAYRPFWTDTKGLRTIKWPSTLGFHLSWRLKERNVGALLTAVIKVSNGIVRRQAIGSPDPVHPVSATSWSNIGCWVVMSCRDMGEPDSCRKREKGSISLFCQQNLQPYHERSMKESLRISIIDEEVETDRDGTCTLPPTIVKERMFKFDCRLGGSRVHCNSVGVATEGTNVFLDPFQCETLWVWLGSGNNLTFNKMPTISDP